MMSKSFNSKQKTNNSKQNRTFDFTNYYKTAAETSKALENKQTDNVDKENLFTSKNINDNLERKHSRNKKKSKDAPLDISHIDIEGPISNKSGAKHSSLNESKLTSTPQTDSKSNKISIMKSIIKCSNSEDTIEDIRNTLSSGKSKKRNKSVSFMLDETDEIIVKKSKSNESIDSKTNSSKNVDTPKDKRKKHNKFKKNGGEKYVGTNGSHRIKDLRENGSESTVKEDMPAPNIQDTPNEILDKEEPIQNRKKMKKMKKQNHGVNSETEPSGTNNLVVQEKTQQKKTKKKKKVQKSGAADDVADGEPVPKSRKKEEKPDAIVENLESLSIGENAHTLTNLLDEMSVAEKNKRKKNKRKLKKERQDKIQKQTLSMSSNDNAEVETSNGKNKIKWTKRKWNKDKKGDPETYNIETSVIIENIPISMICTYKKQLANHFSKYGLIRRVGIAEVYPALDPTPVFTTKIQFYSEGAASEALAAGQVSLEGATLRVRRGLPAPATTLVVRGRGLAACALGAALAPAGRISEIRLLTKGKKALKSQATAFVEFDGPEAVGRALELARGITSRGKPVHAARFQYRPRPDGPPAPAADDSDSDGENSDE